MRRWRNDDFSPIFTPQPQAPAGGYRMDEIVHRILRFDRFALDLTRGCLRSGDRDLELRPKAFEVLLHLVENAGRLVGKEELQRTVWRDVVVSDDSLVQCIRQLRRTLGDDDHLLIKTVSRRGYLLDAQVYDHDHEGTSSPQPAPARAADTSGHVPGELSGHHHEAIENDVAPGEWKLVTVLYADVKDSLELLNERDPEQALDAFEAVLKLMTQAVERYEGTVSLVTADGIFALFGAPLANEDHAERASHAALEIHQAVERHAKAPYATAAPLRVRIGLNSGEVVIRSIRNGQPRAMGPTMHAASRIGQLAVPGTSLLGRSTRRLTEGRVGVRPIALAAGDARDELVFELVGAGPARTRFQARMARGLTPFVGRESELAQLNYARELASKGHGQVAAIVGEAGVGKSRLVHEFAQTCGSQGWGVLECASVSYGKGMSYLPVIGLLKSYFNVKDSDGLRQVDEKVTTVLRGSNETPNATGPALLGLLDVPVDDPVWLGLDPKERRQRTLDAVKQLLLREAQRRPLLVIFEDLHWIDSETQALLDLLIGSIGSSQQLLLVTYRLEYQHAWSSKTFYSQLRLDPLRVNSAAQLLETLLGNEPELTPLKQRLVKRGNPFFLEETVRTLVETQELAGEVGRYRLTRPVEAIQVPPTVQAILTARIDRLSPEDKRLLQVAAVVGKDAPYALLQAVAELPDDTMRRQLDSLQAAELLYETALPDLGYSFKHALTHEVTYGGLLHEHRRDLHARIVGALERLHADRLGEQLERLAHHAVQGQLREKAVEYLRRAGQKAAARSALSDARVWFEQALVVLEGLPDTKAKLEASFEIRYELRHMLFQLGEVRRGLERLREAEALAERLNDDHRRGRVCAALMHLHSILGELDEALAAGNRALEFAARLGDLGLRIQTTTYLVQVHCYRAEYPRAIELATANLATLPADAPHEFFGLPAPPAVYTRVWLVPSFAHLGRFAEAAQCGAGLLQLAESTQLPFAVGGARLAMAELHVLRGDWARAHSQIEPVLVGTRNTAIVLPGAIATSASVLAELGEVREALARLQEGDELLDRQVAQGMITQHLSGAYHGLARACLVLGRLDDARRLVDRAIEYSGGRPRVTTYALHLLGDIATHTDRFDAETGEAHYRQALALAEPRGMRPVVAHCHFGLGKLCQRVGKQKQARMHLATATAMYREMDMSFYLEQVEAETGPTA
jgi:DNA-binding winged helix-turn-helix (wHTH) protein/tetratricopeptide (TPR) repeat protein